MAKHIRQGRQIFRNVRQEAPTGLRIDPGPHIGIVKHVLDTVRSNGLLVYIPHLGGDPDNINNQRFVQYASPYFGHTNFQENALGQPNINNTFQTVRHSYGMWMSPPDVGVRVLCVFANGDPNNGFYIGCIPPAVEHNMVGTSGGVEKEFLETRTDWIDPNITALIKGYGTEFAPGVEYNATANNALGPNVLFNKIPPHTMQTKILAEQGLLADPDRGIDGATSTREAPSAVFGITTPGRTVIDQTTDDYLQRVTENPVADTTKIKEKVEFGRKGGHQFTMDDGDLNGDSRRIKIRSAAGNQVILDDTNGFIYISNSTGKAWIELTNDGQMLAYFDKGASLRYKGDLNVKVDGDYNLDVSGNYNMNVGQLHKTESATREEVVTGSRSSTIGDTMYQTVGTELAINVGTDISITAGTEVAIDAGTAIGITAGATMSLLSADGGWDGGSELKFSAGQIHWNGGAPAAPVTPFVPETTTPFTKETLAEAAQASGIWSATGTQDPSILPASPTHEPYTARTSLVTPLVSGTGQPSKKV